MAKGQDGRTTSDILSAKQIAEFEQKLSSERQRILDLYAHDLKAGQESKGEESDDLVDRANHAYNRELMFSLSNAEREQLIEIDDAIKRLEEGKYGFCLYSGEPIDLRRLEAVPWARYSIQYQELAEKGLLNDDAS